MELVQVILLVVQASSGNSVMDRRSRSKLMNLFHHMMNRDLYGTFGCMLGMQALILLIRNASNGTCPFLCVWCQFL